ncbi:HEAT repeat domain-containing protein [Roseivirga sp. BDSF3-8]|uniref:HEAT repeat domain-containing protein n=1 Tax=Roseivirga sp. BDSF3-8 TaxID=3241598 RepID=UPI00353227E8
MFPSPVKITVQLRKARQELERKLLKSDLIGLLRLMDSDELYSDLLQKHQSRLISSDYFVSWYARKRASLLYTDFDKRELTRLLDHPDYQHLQRHIYYALSHMCKNRCDQQLYQFLLERLQHEEHIPNKLALLSGMGEIGKGRKEFPEAIVSQMNSRNVALKLQAIGALRNCKHPNIESLLIRKFKYSRSYKVKMAICFTLETIGTRHSLTVLRESAQHTTDMHFKGILTQSIEKIKSRVVKANLSVA